MTHEVAMALTCADILAGRAPAETTVTLKGWVRTRRDSKAGISFVHVSDGSCFHPVQVVAPNTLPNYADEVTRLTAGCAVEAAGKIVTMFQRFAEPIVRMPTTASRCGSPSEAASVLWRMACVAPAAIAARRGSEANEVPAAVTKVALPSGMPTRMSRERG
jgi:hypothetical protein